MKLHRISLLAMMAAGALLAISTSLAQENKPERPQGGPRAGQRENAKERLAKIAEDLKLSEEQKTKVAAALKEQAEALRGLRDATPEERRAKMQEARKSFDASLKGILSAEQYAKWEKTREARRGEGRGEGQGPRGPRPNRPEKE